MTKQESKEIESRLAKICIDGIRGFIKYCDIMRKPGIVFTEEQKKKIMESGDSKYIQQEILLLLEEDYKEE